MADFVRISPQEISENPFCAIGQDWMLITAKKPDGTFNTMTASWGGMGVLWNKNVAFCFVRPGRYTAEFIDSADTLTLSFFGGDHRDALTLLGRKSGRDCDKLSMTDLTPIPIGDSVSFAQSTLILHCRKLYCGALEEGCFLDKSLLSNYTQGDYHRVFICEITEVYKR